MELYSLLQRGTVGGPALGESTHTVFPLMVHMPADVEIMAGAGAAAPRVPGEAGAKALSTVFASGEASSWRSETFPD